MSDKSQPTDPAQGDPTGGNPEGYAGAEPDDTIPQAATPDAGGSRWEHAVEEPEAGVGDAPQAAPPPVPMTAHPTGDPTTGDSLADDPTTPAGTASWAGRLGLRGDGAGPSPWARRIGLAGAAAALVAVGGVSGYAVGNAGDGGDRFSPTSSQVDGGGDGVRGDRHGRGDHDGQGLDGEDSDGQGFPGEGFPGQGEGFGAPGDDGQTDQSDGTDTTT